MELICAKIKIVLAAVGIFGTRNGLSIKQNHGGLFSEREQMANARKFEFD